MKTQNEILTDIFLLINASPITALNGGVYKKTRPTNSELEDCVINVIPGTAAKFLQNGALYVKIFYKDIFANNTYYEDSVNAQSKELLLYNFSETLLRTVGYHFDIRSRELYSESVSEIYQHYVILKINFQITMK